MRGIKKLFFLALFFVFFGPCLNAQPEPPVYLRLYSRASDNLLTWGHNPQNAAGYVSQYQIYRGTTSGALAQISAVAGTATNFYDSTPGYAFDQEFFYAVTAVGTDTLISDYSDEVFRFLPKVSLTDTDAQILTTTDQQFFSMKPYPHHWTDTYLRVRSQPMGGSNYGGYDYGGRQVVRGVHNYNLPPGGPYYLEVRVGRPDWHDNPANRLWVSLCSSLPFYVDAEVPFEDNASSTYFNSSNYRVMSQPLSTGGVSSTMFSNSGGGFWRMRQPLRIRPHTERLLDPTSYLSKLNAPCRATISISPGQMSAGRSIHEVRVADEHGNEIPSIAMGETTSGPWVTSFDVHFIANQDYNEWQTYWVYYLNPSASQTNYGFKDSFNKTSQFEYSPWFSRKILRGANESATISDAYRLIPNPPSPADDDFAPITLPFVFPYYNVATNTIYVSSNGYVSLQPHSAPTNTWAEFTGNNPQKFIAPFWANLMVNDSVPGDSGVYGRVMDSNDRRRRYQITWRANRFNATNEIYIFQAALYLLGDIALRYETLNFNALFATPSGSNDNPLRIAPHHTAGISATDGSNWASIADQNDTADITPIVDGTGRNVIHFFQSCHSWTFDSTFTDDTNICSKTGYTTVGHYDSRIFDGRSSDPTWTNIEIDTSGSGLIDFYLRTSASLSFPDWDTSHLLASDLAAGPHSLPLTLPNDRYVQYRAVLKKSAVTDNPILDRVKFSVGYVTIDEISNQFNNSDVSQGQIIPASMTFSNFYSNPVDAEVASLTFTAAASQVFSRTTPMPSAISYQASATIGFDIIIDENSGNLDNWTYVDGYLEAGDGITTLSSSEAITTSRYRIREKARLVIDKVDTPFDKVNKGQGGIPVTVQLSNTSAYVPLVFNGASLTFTLGDYSWTSEPIFTPGGQGFYGQYYNTNTSNPPVFPQHPHATRIDPQVNFSYSDWASGVSPYPPDINTDYYGVRWSGLLTPDFNEEYTFEIMARGGVWLWINNKLVIDSWVWSSATRTGKIVLQAGVPVDIVMEYYKLTGAGRAILSWSSPSLAKEVLPDSHVNPTYRSVISRNETLITTFTVAVLPDSPSGLAYINSTATGTNGWAINLLTEAFSADIIDSWVIQSPASLSVGVMDVPNLVYRGQGNVPVDVEIINLGEADAEISSVPVFLDYGTYTAIEPGETMPVVISGDSSKYIRVLVSIAEDTATGTVNLDADVIGKDGNVGTPLFYSGAASPGNWTILAEKILTYSDASYLLPLTSFVRPEAGSDYIYVMAENLAPLKEYSIRWYDTSDNEMSAYRTIGFADADGKLFSELEYDSSFAYGIYNVRITNPINTFTPAQTNFSIVTSAELSGKYVIPEKVSVGQTFPLYLELENSGGAQASSMVASALIRSGTGWANYVFGPVPGSLNVAGNSQATYSWNYTAAASGTFRVIGHASGFEAGSDNVLSVPPGRNALYLEETFEDYPAGESIASKSSGFGWSGPWSGSAGNQILTRVDNSMTYTPAVGQTIYGGYNAIKVTGDDNNVLLRSLSAAIGDPEIYISMLMRFNGTQGNNKFTALWLENNGYGAAPNIGIKMNQGGGGGVEDFFIRTQANEAYSVDLVPGQTYLVVGRVSKFAGTGTYDQFELWVNPPDLSAPPAPDAFTSGVSLVNEFTRVGIRSLNLTAADSVDIAFIRIGKTWDSVVAQPLRSDECLIQTPAQVTINALTATPTIVFYDQQDIEVMATLQNHGEADARIDIAELLQTPTFGSVAIASPSLPAVLPGESIATYVFNVSISNYAPIGLATLTARIRYEDINNPTPVIVEDQTHSWMIVDTRIVCSRSATFSPLQYVFNAGQTVFAKADGLPNNIDVRVRFYETSAEDPPTGIGVGIPTPLNTGTDGTVTHFHDIPADTDKLNQWMVVVDDGDDFSLGNILGAQYFIVGKAPELDLQLIIGSSTCFIGDLVKAELKVSNVSTWSTDLRHYLQNYSTSAVVPTPESTGYMSVTELPADRGWFYDLLSGTSHSFDYIMKAQGHSGTTGASLSLMVVNDVWRYQDLNTGSDQYNNPFYSNNSITIYQKDLEVIPDSFTKPLAPGLLGEYYQSSTNNPPPMPFGPPNASRADLTVNFDWGGGSPYPVEIGNDYYAIRWSGYVVPDHSETYTFYTRTDDGARLWVNNTQLVERWQPQGATEINGTIALTAGVAVPIVFEYFERGGGAVAELRWSSPSTPKAIIPSTNLHHELPFSITWDFGTVEPGATSPAINNTIYALGNHSLDKIEMLKTSLRKSVTEIIGGSQLQETPPMPYTLATGASTPFSVSLQIPFHQPQGTYIATMTVFEDHRKTDSFEVSDPHRQVFMTVAVPSHAKAIVSNDPIDFGVVAAGTTSAIRQIDYISIGNEDLTDLKFEALPDFTFTPQDIGFLAFNGSGSINAFIEVSAAQPPGVFYATGTIFNDIPGGASDTFTIKYEVGSLSLNLLPDFFALGNGTPTQYLDPYTPFIENTGELPLARLIGQTTEFVNISQPYSVGSDSAACTSPLLINLAQTEPALVDVYIPGGVATGTYISTFTWFEDQNENLTIDSFEAQGQSVASFVVESFYNLYTLKPTEDFGGVKPDNNKTIIVGIRNAGSLEIPELGFIINDLSDGFDPFSAALITPPVSVPDIVPGELRYFNLSAYVPLFQKHSTYMGTATVFGDINSDGFLDPGEPFHEFNLRIEVGDQEVSIDSPATLVLSGNAASITPPEFVTIKNTGTLALTRVKAKVSEFVPVSPGTNIASSTFVYNPSAIIGSLVPTQSSTFSGAVNIPFAQTPGDYEGTLWVWEDANNDNIIQSEEASASISIELEVVYVKELQTSPAIINLGFLARGDLASASFLAQNIGNTDLKDARWQLNPLVGPGNINPGNFSISPDPVGAMATPPVGLPNSTPATFSLTVPTGAADGIYAGSMIFYEDEFEPLLNSYNAGLDPNFSLQINVQVVTPFITINPDPINIPAGNPTGRTGSATFTISNSNLIDFKSLQYNISNLVNGSHVIPAGNIAILPNSFSPLLIGQNESIEISAVLGPQTLAPGVYSGNITIWDDRNQNNGLDGWETGVPAEIRVSVNSYPMLDIVPTLLDIGTIARGTTGSPVNIGFINNGNVDLNGLAWTKNHITKGVDTISLTLISFNFIQPEPILPGEAATATIEIGPIDGTQELGVYGDAEQILTMGALAQDSVFIRCEVIPGGPQGLIPGSVYQNLATTTFPAVPLAANYYILSAYVSPGTGTANVAFMDTDEAGIIQNYFGLTVDESGNVTTTPPAITGGVKTSLRSFHAPTSSEVNWYKVFIRFPYAFDESIASHTYILLQNAAPAGLGHSAWFDGIQLEEVESDILYPTTYSRRKKLYSPTKSQSLQGNDFYYEW